MTKTNRLTLAVAVATLASLSAKAQGIIAYDNSSNYEDFVTARGNTEVGDEINLTTGASTITDFQFEYNYTGAGGATGVVRIYDKTGNGGLTPGATPLLESSAFTLLPGFNQGALHNLSLSVPGTIIWTVSFSGINVGAGENAGLLFYNGVGVGGNPGESFDDHWEFTGTIDNPTPHWVLANNTDQLPGGPAGTQIIDNFGARVTVVPEPGTMALIAGGAALLGFAARRRKA